MARGHQLILQTFGPTILERADFRIAIEQDRSNDDSLVYNGFDRVKTSRVLN